MSAALEITIRAPEIADEASFLRAHQQLAKEDFTFGLHRLPGDSWAQYVARLRNFSLGVDVPEDFVPATFLVAVAQNEVVGRVSVRHRLNDYLEQQGGHIGYGVVPRWRGRGVATMLLRHGLEICNKMEIEHALLFCDEDNVASAKTIERCDGVFEAFVEIENEPRMKRYRVPTK